MDNIAYNINYTKSRWTKHLRYLGNFLYTEKGHYYLFYKYLNKIGHQKLRNKILIDIGFGSGYNIYHIHKKYKIKTIGLDIVDETVNSYNRKEIKNSYAIKIDPYINNIPFKNEEIDYIICSHVLEHVPDDKHLLNEIFRVLKRGGIAFFNIPINEGNIIIPTHIRKYTPKSFKQLLQQYNFKIIEEHIYDFYTLKISYLASRKNWLTDLIKKLFIFILSLLPIEFTLKSNLFNWKPGQYTIIAEKKR